MFFVVDWNPVNTFAASTRAAVTSRLRITSSDPSTRALSSACIAVASSSIIPQREVLVIAAMSPPHVRISSMSLRNALTSRSSAVYPASSQASANCAMPLSSSNTSETRPASV